MRSCLVGALALGLGFACSAQDEPYAGSGPLPPAIDRKHVPAGDAGDPQLVGVDASFGAPPSKVFQPLFGTTVSQDDAPPPIFGGTLAVTRAGDVAIAADPDRGAVFLVQLATKSVRVVPTGARSLPFRVAEDGARRAHVTLRGTGEVATIDLFSGQIVARRWVCGEPRGLAWDSASDRVHVACESGLLVSLPAAGGDAVRSVQLPGGLRDVIVDGDSLVVSRFREASLVRVGPEGAVVSEVSAPSDSTARAEVAWRTLASPAGPVMIHQLASKAPLAIAAASVGGYGGGCGSAVTPVMTTLGGAGPRRVGLSQLVLPVDAAISPDGKTTLVVSPANSHTPKLLGYGFFGPKEQPASACGGGGGGEGPVDPLPADPSVPRQFVAAAYDGHGHALLQSREPAELVVLDEAVPHAIVATIPLSDVSRADTGHLVFHSNSGAFLACASCHPEGGDDGHVWTFAGQTQFARRTPSLRGTVKGTAPYHWDGAFADVPALLADVFSRRMAGPDLDDEQAAAVKRWVEAVPAPKPEPAADWAAVGRGEALFAGAARCTSCHSGARRTNNLTVDVGTGGKFQTPSLIGISARAPYLHDGSVPSLESRFDATGGSKHGDTSALGPREMADLLAYLRAL